MSEPICKNCGNTGLDALSQPCPCSQALVPTPPPTLTEYADKLKAAKEKVEAALDRAIKSQPQGMTVRFKRLHKDAVLPKYAKPGDAGLDLVAIDNGMTKKVAREEDGVTRTATFREYSTGIAVEIPAGFVGLIFPRSSISNMALSLANSVGVIDSGYRGELNFRFRILDETAPLRYSKGDRIGQLVIIPYPQINVVEADDLSATERGTGGWGSSGK